MSTGNEDYGIFGVRVAGALDSYFSGGEASEEVAIDVLLASLKRAAKDCGIELAGVTS